MKNRLLPADAAASRVGIKRQTLYAYVSRGLITAHRMRDRRGSWFDPVQLDRLVQRARDPAERPAVPQIASAITLIERGRYWYRGQPPDILARRHSYEAVAEFLWTGELPEGRVSWPFDRPAVDRAKAMQALLPAGVRVADRLRIVVAALGAADPLRYDLRPAGALATARRLMAGVIAAIASRRGGTLAEQIASVVSPRRRLSIKATRAIDTALVVMADHELAPSTLAVRVAASYKADPYAAISAGLGAMAGAWHGAASRRLELALREIERGRVPEEVVGDLLRGDTAAPGFGHPLYPEGDPRVQVLMPLARSFAPLTEADALLRVAGGQGLSAPNVDFALAVLARALRLTIGSGEVLFTIARLAGWLAHALEEYATRTPFRHRAVYAGPRPD